ncbi:unnamed protein product [Schistocephalus solidus]|uniref:Endo/exonuclease/phosphatase domain-containing protein n=1 Tax=Schistocephalus solidus TaxID=70667 RepID=A0A183T7L4_SCHSO|nr:unnamed protein product [Schistocephalus solidus]
MFLWPPLTGTQLSPVAPRSWVLPSGHTPGNRHDRRAKPDNPRRIRPERRTALVARELARYKVDIAALGEIRFSEQVQLEEARAGYTFWSGWPKVERSDAGVAFAIRNDIVGRLPCLPPALLLCGIRARCDRTPRGGSAAQATCALSHLRSSLLCHGNDLRWGGGESVVAAAQIHYHFKLNHAQVTVPERPFLGAYGGHRLKTFNRVNEIFLSTVFYDETERPVTGYGFYLKGVSCLSKFIIFHTFKLICTWDSFTNIIRLEYYFNCVLFTLLKDLTRIKKP